MLGGEVVGLDLGQRMGYACGVPGAAPPYSTVFLLKRDGEPPAVAFSNLLHFLIDQFAGGKPRLVAKEGPLTLRAMANTSDASIRFTYGLHAIVEAACFRFEVPLFDVHESTACKFFTGKGSQAYGGSPHKKLAIRRRAVQLRYVAFGEDDENRCDALMVWDWACATHAKAPPRELVLFPPQRERPPKNASKSSRNRVPQ